MAESTADMDHFINKALAYLSAYYKGGLQTGSSELTEVYPYIFRGRVMPVIENVDEKTYIFDYLGVLYESLIPIDLRKDFGQFYTKEDTIIETMLESLDLLEGKILEPSCGSGMFLVKVINKLIARLQQKSYSSQKIVEYICSNIYANDLDVNATIIAEINILATLMPLILDAKKLNPGFVMKRLKITNSDFIEKNRLTEKYALVIGNPPFITMYGKHSRNMTEAKRAYYNTFDFVQKKNGNNKFNSSMFFLENGLKLLKKGGRLCYILDIAFFETAFTDMRKFIVENYFINSVIRGLQIFKNVASGQLIINITNMKAFNTRIDLIDYSTNIKKTISQEVWNNPENKYRFIEPLNEKQKSINEKILQCEKLEIYFPNKSLRTCCALTGKTDNFIVDPLKEKEHIVFPYIEGSKGLMGKFYAPTPKRYIKYDYELQLELSEKFKEELTALGVKNKKRVTLGDKEAYLAPKIFIRQSATEIIATYCSKPYAANNSIYILTTKMYDKKSIHMLKYTCGLLNSDLITFFCRINKIIRVERGKTPQIKISDLKNLRLHVDYKYYDEIIYIVEKLLQQPNDLTLHKRLNKVVYEIYGISPEEIEFINQYLAS